jgi:hypothetical protein
MIDILNFSKYLASFLFFILIVLGGSEARRSPGVILFVGGCLVFIGFPLLFYSLRTMERYKKIMDYEPVEFWKKTRNGKETREILTSLNVLGLGCFLSGLILILTVIFKIQIIPVLL